MRHAKIFIVAVTCLLAASLQLAVGQGFGAPMPRNTVPETIQSCYHNYTAFNRLNRQPMHIDNLITIIRKIETKTFGEWDIRRIARTLVHRYMFDGIEYNPDAKLEFAYNQKAVERMKSMMVKELIPIKEEEIFPHGVLDNDEMCALHWMLSHSMNATMRDDEPGQGTPPYGYGSGSGSGYNPNSNNPNSGGGSNSYGGNNNNNPYGNNNNGNGYNNNPVMGNNYNRGKRDVNGNNSQEAWDWQSDGNSESNEDDNENPDTPGANDTQPLASNENKEEPEDKSQEKDISEESHEDVVILDQSLLGGKSISTEKSGKQISVSAVKTTRRPVETGVVYTKWGSISAGRLIAGIAAALEPMAMSPINGNVYADSSFGSGPGYGSNSGGGSGGFGGSNSGGFGGYGGSNSGSGNPGYGGSNAGSGYNGNGNYNPSYKGNDNQYQYGQGQSSSSNGRRNRKKRQTSPIAIKGLYAATLAGDVGQAAILNGQNTIPVGPPTGAFNNSICPREYILDQHTDPNKEIFDAAHSWTYLTVAEIRGGLDGIVIGSNIKAWEPRLRLSDILSMYYSETGVSVPGEQNYRSCDRSTLYSQFVDGNTLRDQSRSFAGLYNNKTKEISDQTLTPIVLDTMIRETTDKMNFAIGALTSSDARCTQQSGGGSMNDNNKYTTPKLTVYAVLDHSATPKEIEDQKMFFGQLVHSIGVNPTGSRLGIVDGNSGSIMISPNWTDSSPILACRILSLPTHTKSQDYSRVMTNIKTEIEKMRNDEISKNYTNDNGVVVLLMVQGRKLETGQRDEIKRITTEINEIYGGVSVIASSSKYGESDFEGIKFLRIQPTANFSDAASEFASSLVKNTHGALRYPTCNAFVYDQDYEHTNFINTYISPDEIKYIKISPDYFFSARNLILRFTAENGKVRICESRDQPYPNSGNEGSDGVDCSETKGSYVDPGKSDIDVEFTYKQPCGKKGKKEDCRPIYLSITPTSSLGQGESSRLDCSREPCQSPNQVRVTFTHWDMRCNGAIKTLFSSTLFIITSLVTVMNLFKNF